MKYWYYLKDNQQHGPLPENELQACFASGKITAHAWVWSKDMRGWTRACEVTNLVPSDFLPPAIPLAPDSQGAQLDQQQPMSLPEPSVTFRDGALPPPHVNVEEVADTSTSSDVKHVSSKIEETKKSEIMSPCIGLSGWLALVGLMIVIAPLRLITMVFPMYMNLFSSGQWALLTNSGTETYIPWFGTLLFGEILFNGIMIAGWVYVAVLFFSKRKNFPVRFIGILIFNLLFISLDAVSAHCVIPDVSVFGENVATELLRAFIPALIWIPYMLLSQRVKGTFVN